MKVYMMNMNEFRGLATALQTMALPQADASFDDLLARLETVPSTRDVLRKAMRAKPSPRGFILPARNPRPMTWRARSMARRRTAS